MKRISIFLIASLLSITPALRAQDAAAAAAKADRDAAEERYKRLSSAVDDLLAAQTEQQKRIAALAKEIESLREQQSRPRANYASEEDLRHLAEKIQEIDRKRADDKELILKEISKLGKAITAPPPRSKAPVTDTAPTATADRGKGYEYEVQSGDTLSVIVQAYREKGIKVTVDQILKANPKLEPTKLRVGQKIWIPSPEKP
ncbi:MAG: LysM peptidoglycan-binding domain-containing protein [Verrucomicrobia bacterium]|nr:LysM peptidoglycan-binding domain-containing protein [Verrucomicrobiota bacterium]